MAMSGAGNGIRTPSAPLELFEAAHSVFTHRSHPRESCPQCPPNQNENSANVLLHRNGSSVNLSSEFISNDQIVAGCQECNRNSQRSNSRGRRQRRSSSATTPEPFDSNTENNTAAVLASHQSSSRRSRSSRSRSNRSRQQRRQRRRQQRRITESQNTNTNSTQSDLTNNTTTAVDNNQTSTTNLENGASNSNNASASNAAVGPEEEAAKCQIRQWPHNLSFLFACLTCTLSMFSISRFAILTIDFGVTFILQFLLLSILFGIPLFVFHVSLGQYLGSGVIDVWRISPIHQGIGIALMISQGLYGIYNIAAISWLFVYFRDSFITAFDRYKWSSCSANPKYGRNCDPLFQLLNNTLKLEESIPDYYNGQVLLRSSPNYPQTFSGELRFQTLFHIIVIWMSVFIGLSKGLKSYGKVVYIFSISPC